MGVLGLWQLLESTSRTAKIEGLEGKTLAIDISIWLYQAANGYKSSPNGHIVVLYNRICKLLYYKIKPIFVFDGPNVPKLKQRVLQERRNRHNPGAAKNQSLENKIKKNMLNAAGISDKDGRNDEQQPTTSRQAGLNNKKFSETNFDVDDLFVLPENNLENFDVNSSEDEMEEVAAAASSSFGYVNFEEIDKNVLESLPDEIKYEIYADYRARLKERKAYSFNEFPKTSEDFSSYQMSLLMKKGHVLNELKDIKKKINQNYLAGTNFDEAYVEKVSSTVDQEVILFTKKSTLFESPSLEAKKVDDKSPTDETLNTKSLEKTETTSSSPKQTQLRDESDQFDVEIIDENPKTAPSLKTTPEKKETNQINEVGIIENAKETSIRSPLSVKSTPSKEANVTTDSLNVTQESQKSSYLNLNDLNLTQKSTIASENEQATEHSPKVQTVNSAPVVQTTVETTKIDKKAPSEEVLINSDSSDSDADFVEVEPTDDLSDCYLIEEVKKTNAQNAQQRQIEQLSHEQDEILYLKTALESWSKNDVIDLEEGENRPHNGLTEPTAEDPTNEGNVELFEEIVNLMRQTTDTSSKTGQSQSITARIEAHIIEDAKQLITLFGLPYIESPGEAEAQCAYLDYTDQTEGSITEDSDTWLFGGKRVYKNFFGSEPCIDFYTIDAIKSLLGLTREDLIDVALLVGSDYTLGIENVGIVKAVEILKEFDGSGIEKLKKFKEWHTSQKGQSKYFSKVKSALAKLNLPDNFPSEIVFNAYINPHVDMGVKEFDWSLPELDQIRKFMINKLGWTIKRLDDDLLPIMKRIQDKKVQKTIENFFMYDRVPTFSKQSKRMKNALSTFRSKINAGPASTTDKNDTKPTASTGKKVTKKTTEDVILSEDEDDDEIMIIDNAKQKSNKNTNKNQLEDDNNDDETNRTRKKTKTTTKRS